VATHITDCKLPHHKVFQRLASIHGFSVAAQTLLGLRTGQLLTISDPERLQYGIQQQFIIAVNRSERTPLLPLGNSEAMSLEVKAELPSSVTLTFKLEGGKQLALSAHVHPSGYDSCTVTLAMKRNFARWPGSDRFAGCAVYSSALQCSDFWCAAMLVCYQASVTAPNLHAAQILYVQGGFLQGAQVQHIFLHLD
jgi:hypothetical protein